MRSRKWNGSCTSSGTSDEYPNHFVAVDLRTDEVVLAREDGMAFYEALRAMDRDQFQTLYTFHTALFSPQG